MGGAVFPPCHLPQGPRGNGHLLQKNLRYHAVVPRTIVVSAPDPIAGNCCPTPLLETLEHSQASLAQSLVGSLLLYPGSLYAHIFICALQESVSPVLWKFCNQIPLAFKVKSPGVSQSSCHILRLGNMLWVLEILQQYERTVLQLVGHLLGSSMVALMMTTSKSSKRLKSSKRTHATHCLPGLLQPEPLSPWQATDDLCLSRRHSNTQSQVWLSLLWGSLHLSLSLGAYKVLFAPSEHLWWVWSLILNMISPLLGIYIYSNMYYIYSCLETIV